MLKRVVTTGLTVAVATLGATAFAQEKSQAPSGGRVAELVAHARQAYDEGLAKGLPDTVDQAKAPATRTVMRLSVEEAVSRALENNIELSVERLNPQLQDLALAQVRAFYRPTVTSLGSMNSNMPLPTSLLTGGTRVKNDTLNLNAGITQALPWYGSNVTFSWNNPRTDTTSTFATLNPQYSPSMTVNFTQPLLRDFRIDSTRQSLLTSSIARDISNTTLRARIINTEANTRNAYWDYVHAGRAVEAAQRSLSLAEKLVEDNRVRVEVGTLAPIDIVQAEAEAASRRQSLTAADATRRTAELTLKRLIVASTDDALWNASIDPTSAVQVEARAVDLEGAVKKALTDRTDLSNARRQLESNDVSIRYLKNQMLPALGATLTYGTRGLGGNTFVRQNGEVTGTVPGGWADAMKTLSKFDYPTWTVQFNFSYPLGNSAQDASYARAKVQYQQAQAQLRALELQVATEVTNAALNVDSTQKRLDASRAARVLAERRLEAEQTKFEVGMQTNFFVVQAQRDLLDAQITELRASLDYQKALIEFERVQVTTSGGSSVTTVSTATTTVR
jgi:outer membrane protein TolC